MLADENLTSKEKCAALKTHLILHLGVLEAISEAAGEFKAYSNRLVESVKNVADGVTTAGTTLAELDQHLVVGVRLEYMGEPRKVMAEGGQSDS